MTNSNDNSDTDAVEDSTEKSTDNNGAATGLRKPPARAAPTITGLAPTGGTLSAASSTEEISSGHHRKVSLPPGATTHPLAQQTAPVSPTTPPEKYDYFHLVAFEV